MKKIFKIARLELSILFYSPIAWLLLILFIIQAGMTYFSKFDSFDLTRQMGQQLRYITFEMFNNNNYGVFSTIQKNLYLYIPLLTMGLISREKSTGSIKLLFSSPVKVREIVIGKFFAMVAYCFALMGILFVFTLIASYSIESMEITVVLGGLLGIFLLACAYSAIGLFMSCLTSYQVVAAISTLGVLAFLNFIGEVGQSIDFVRDITYWLSISGRCDTFIGGLITSKDIIYFLIVILLFLTLSVMKLSGGRQIRTLPVKIMRYAGLILAAIIIGYISSLPTLTGYWDTTRNLRCTLSENSQKIVQKIDKPIKITTYVNILDYKAFYGMPSRKIYELTKFEKYQRFIPDLKIEYVYYYDYPVHWNRIKKRFPKKTDEELLVHFAEKTCIANRLDINNCLTPKQIKKIINLKPEENRLVRTVEYDGKKCFLRMFDDMLTYPGEAEITACLKNLTGNVPTIGFLKGHLEPSIYKKGDRDYKSISNVNPSRGALINQGFRVKEVPVDKEIPMDISGLVLAEPKLKYSDDDIVRIKNYINKGGNIIIAGEPGKQNNINPLIEELGVKLSEGTILQESEDFDLDLVIAKYEKTASKAGFYVNPDINITMPSVCGLEYNNNKEFNYIPLLKCEKEKCWNRIGKIDLESGTEKFDPEKDKKTKAILALALCRNINNKKQKIVVTGDADFMSNAELGRHNVKRQKNSAFAMTIFKWFSNGEYPISVRIARPLDNKLEISRASILGHKIFCLGLIPLALLICGILLLIKRKRR